MASNVAPRFPPIAEADLSEGQLALANIYKSGWRKALARPDGSFGGPFDATMRSPGYAAAAMAISDYIRNETTVPKDIREITILMVVRAHGCQFEWKPHVLLALQAGLSLDALHAIHNHGKPQDLTQIQSVTYDAVYELIHNHGMSDKSFEALKAAIGEAWLIDIIALAGHYMTASMILNTARLTRPDPLPAGMPDFVP